MPSEIVNLRELLPDDLDVVLGGKTYPISTDPPIPLAERIGAAFTRIVEKNIDEKFMAACKQLALDILNDLPKRFHTGTALKALPAETTNGEVVMLIVTAQMKGPPPTAAPAAKKKTATARKRTRSKS